MKRILSMILVLSLLLVLGCAAMAEETEKSVYTVKTGVSYTDPWGITVANVIYKDGEAFKILLDTVRPDGGISSKEKHNDYGIGRASTIGKDWWEQIIFVEQFAEQYGVDAFEMTEDGYAGNPDAVSGATFHVVYYVDALHNAEAGITEEKG